MSEAVVAVDVGGTTIKSALVTRDGTIVERSRRLTRAADGTDVVFTEILTAINELRTAAGTDHEVVGIGVVVTGLVDDEEGIAIHSENVGWAMMPLRSMLSERTGLPIGFGHDVRGGALAEARLGAGRGLRSFAFVPIGTGVSAGLFLNGQLFTGDGYIGEIGHVNSGRDVVCGCGGRGCVEAVASAAAIARRYTEATGTPADGAKDVAQRMQLGDTEALRIWNEAVAALADALAWMTGVLAPEAIIIGGGMAAAGDLLLAPLREQLAARLNILRRPELIPAQLGDEAGCLGAAELAWDVLAGPQGTTAAGSSS